MITESVNMIVYVQVLRQDWYMFFTFVMDVGTSEVIGSSNNTTTPACQTTTCLNVSNMKAVLLQGNR